MSRGVILLQARPRISVTLIAVPLPPDFIRAADDGGFRVTDDGYERIPDQGRVISDDGRQHLSDDGHIQTTDS